MTNLNQLHTMTNDNSPSTITNESPTHILNVKRHSIFFTIANINYSNIINSTVASLYVTKQEFSIKITDISSQLYLLKIKKLRIITISKYDDDVYFDKIENIESIKFNLSSFRTFIGKDNINDYLYNTLFIAEDIAWSLIVACMKQSTKAISISGGSNNKRHLNSKLDIRLISYMLAIFGLEMHTLNALNEFDIVDKNRILPFVDYSNRKEIRVTHSNSPSVAFPIKNVKTDQTLKEDNSYLDYSAQELLGLISKENEKKDG